MFNLSVSVCGVIFGVSFCNYALCHLGSSQCNNMLLLNGMGLLIVLPFAFINNVAPFVYFTAICLSIILISLMTVGGHVIGVINSHGVHPYYTTTNWSKFPEFFGVACFSLEGIGLIFPIRGSLKKQSNFKPLFIIVASFFVGVYILFGILCHMGLGDSTKQIIFHNFPTSYMSIYILQLLYALGIFTTFPLYIQSCVNIIKGISCFSRFYEGVIFLKLKKLGS